MGAAGFEPAARERAHQATFEEQRRDALAARHSHLAQFAPRVLPALDLES